MLESIQFVAGPQFVPFETVMIALDAPAPTYFSHEPGAFLWPTPDEGTTMMTVKELIEELAKYPQDAVVTVLYWP